MTLGRRQFLAAATAGAAIPAGAGILAALRSSAGRPDTQGSAANCCGLTVNVRAAPYQARGDGRANDTAAIQAAVRAVATAGGGVIELPAGDYLVDSIRIPAVRGGTIRFVGQGWSYDAGANTRLVSASAVPMFVPASGVNGLELSLVHLDGANIGTHGWFGEWGNKTRLLNVLVDRFTRYGVYFNQGLCELRQSYIRNNKGVGVRTSSDGWYSGCEIAANTGVGMLVSSGGNRITDNLVNSNGSHGIHITGSTAPSNLINSIIGGYIGENVGWNILIEGIRPDNRNIGYTSIVGTYIQQVGPPRAGGIRVRNARQTQIVGLNYLGGPNDTGCIVMESCDSSQIAGVVSSYSSGNIVRLSGCDDISVSGLTSRDHGRAGAPIDSTYGIVIDSACNRCSATDVRITDARANPVARGVRNDGSGSIILGAYSFTGAANPDRFGSAAVMTYDVQGGRWLTRPAR